MWRKRKGWAVETKMRDALNGASETYLINSNLMQMIRDSPYNTKEMQSTRGAVRVAHGF